MINIRDIDLGVLNSLTQYPSIPTYHKLDSSNGVLLDEVTPFSGTVIGTEKVDGTNARIIRFAGPGGWIIGSRTELLHAHSDLIHNPMLGIVEALRDMVEERLFNWSDDFTVFYMELYGGDGQLPAARQYTSSKTFGWRLFDVATFDAGKLRLTREQAASWRQHGGQRYLDEEALNKVARLAEVKLTPRLFALNAADVPCGIEETRDFLRVYAEYTQVALDDGHVGKAEGIVLRSPDRSVIAKARAQDYERTLKRRER